MTDHPTNEPNEELVRALQPLAEQIEAIAATVAPTYEEIGAVLEHLYDNGADENALVDISNNAGQLVQAFNTLNHAATVAQSVAKKAMQQRDQVSSALSQLRSDVQCINTGNDLIQQLVDEVYANEVEFMCEDRNNAVVEDMMNSTPFDESECSFLCDVLCAGYSLSDGLWVDLKAWMRQAREEIMKEYPYMTFAKFSDDKE